MGKKKFIETRMGKLLTGKLVSGVLKTIPFGIGSLAGNILDEVNGSESGSFDPKTLKPQLIKLALYALFAFAVTRGWLTADEASTIIGN